MLTTVGGGEGGNATLGAEDDNEHRGLGGDDDRKFTLPPIDLSAS